MKIPICYSPESEVNPYKSNENLVGQFPGCAIIAPMMSYLHLGNSLKHSHIFFNLVPPVGPRDQILFSQYVVPSVTMLKLSPKCECL
jgi:hypothetical protein